MELGPPTNPSSEQTPSNEKKETKKSKKKEAEKLGAFAVENKPSRSDKKATSSAEQPVDSPSADKLERQLVKNEQALSDIAPELDAEAPLEHLSEVEARAATQELARNRRAEITGELAEAAAASPAADQAAAAEAFLAKAELTGDPETALGDALVELASETVDQPDSADSLASLEITNLADTPDHWEPIERVIDPHLSTEGDLPLNYYDSAIDQANPTTAAAGVLPVPRRSAFGGGAIPNLYAPRPAVPGWLTNPNTISTESANYNERHAQLRGLLVGGIVGYLIGRRRGRIKTEKRLLPVQNKLEKEVQSLQANLLAKEIIIRQATAEKRRVALSPASEQLVMAAVEQKRQAVSESQSAATKLPPERIGHVLISAESVRAVPETIAKLAPSVEKRSVEKQVATMPRAELLAVSEKIVVEGTTLRQIYETHLVGERGLRRLVTEHLSGGDLMRALRRELVEREIDFERDPILRDRARASLAGAGKSALNSLVQQAGAVAVVADSPVIAKQKVAQPLTNISKLVPSSRAAGIALVTTIAVLVLIILLLLTNGQ